MSTLTLTTKNPAGQVHGVKKEFTKLKDAYLYANRFYARCKSNNVACKIQGVPGQKWLDETAARLRTKKAAPQPIRRTMTQEDLGTYVPRRVMTAADAGIDADFDDFDF